MILQLNELRDKLAGCWTGKNVGGVLGAPFECKRMIPNVDFYVQDLTQGPPANDDLDLQIVWLAAVELYGRNVNASILGEYWLSFVIPNWVEYGTGKTNLRAGLVPPLSGDVDNTCLLYTSSAGIEANDRDGLLRRDDLRGIKDPVSYTHLLGTLEDTQLIAGIFKCTECSCIKTYITVNQWRNTICHNNSI